MTAAKPKFRPEPRGWTDLQVAAYLNMSATYFSDRKADLYAAGMPKPDELLGKKTDADALKLWLDKRSGLVDARLESGPKSIELIERIKARYGQTHA